MLAVGILLTVGTGFFVASEFALVNLDRSDLERLVAPADEGRIRRREAMLVAEIDAAVDAGSGPGSDDDVIDV